MPWECLQFLDWGKTMANSFLLSLTLGYCYSVATDIIVSRNSIYVAKHNKVCSSQQAWFISTVFCGWRMAEDTSSILFFFNSIERQFCIGSRVETWHMWCMLTTVETFEHVEFWSDGVNFVRSCFFPKWIGDSITEINAGRPGTAGRRTASCKP